MPKKTDISKIDRIRSAAVEIIGSCGPSGCSVAEIAKLAGVSAGYLYRHYPGKEQLIEDVFGMMFEAINQKISEQIAEHRDTARIVESVVRYVLGLRYTDPSKIKFLIVLTHDLSIKFSDSLLARIDALAEELIGIARQDDRIRAGVTRQDLYFAMVGVPMQYLTVLYNQMIKGMEQGTDFDEHVVWVSLSSILKTQDKTQ